ncbi:hypothetical protein [Serratia proteamaculans]|uniref:hypothetical protein n=1 Tax=Serratia proteamaculans TaxID=28151 RepID=UPI0039AFDAD2
MNTHQKLNLICPFSSPYELWETRELTSEETDKLIENGQWKPFLTVKVKLETTISTPFDAARFIASNKNDSRLDHRVTAYIRENPGYSQWRSYMPSETPDALADYQENYPPDDFSPINQLVVNYGIALPEGQSLFHGGFWPVNEDGSLLDTHTTNRVLSTSLCPKVALNNGDWRGKAYDAGRLDLMVITVKKSAKKAFIFDMDADPNGHELEVLFEDGVQLTLIDAQLVSTKFNTCKADKLGYTVSKTIPVYVLQVELR